MIRYIIGFASGFTLVTVIFVCGVSVGYKKRMGEEAQNTVDVITENVRNYNEDQIELQENTHKIAEEKTEAQAHNQRIPDVAPVDNCKPAALERVYNQTKFTRH